MSVSINTKMYSSFAEQYDKFTSDVDYAARARYFDNLILRHTDSRGILLDLACGTGSLTIEMDKLGYDVMGIDSSYEMLAIARQKAEDYGKELLFVCQRMERLDLYGTVDACVCALDSLNHITNPKTLEQALAKVSLFLHPEGVFIFDVNSIYKHQEVLGNNCYIYQKDGVYCGWQNFTDEHNLTKIELDFFIPNEDGTYYRESESFSERGYTGEELAAALQKAGLAIIDIYGDDSCEPPREDSQRWIYITKKAVN